MNAPADPVPARPHAGGHRMAGGSSRPRTRWEPVPSRPRGSGPVSCECGRHRDRCRVGRPHRWCAPWMAHGQVLRSMTTDYCDLCGAVCTGEEE